MERVRCVGVPREDITLSESKKAKGNVESIFYLESIYAHPFTFTPSPTRFYFSSRAPVKRSWRRKGPRLALRFAAWTK